MRAPIQRITLAAFLLTACKSAPPPSPDAAVGTATAAGTGTGAAARPERPLYYERALTTADLEGRTLRELTLMRNTIYARTGNVFRKKWLHDYFAEQSWYEPTGLDDSKLSAVDRENAEAIAKYETAIPRAELERRRAALADRHAYAAEPEGNGGTLALAGDGSRVATGGEVVDLWDRNGTRVRRLAGPFGEDDFEEWVSALSFSPDARALAVVHDSARIEIFDTASGKILRTIAAPKAWDGGLAFLTGPRWTVARNTPAEVEVWDLQTGKRSATLAAHSDHLAMAGDGTVYLSNDLEVRSWPPGTQTATKRFEIQQFSALSVSRDGRRLIVRAVMGRTEVRDTADGKVVLARDPQPNAQFSPGSFAVALSPDGAIALMPVFEDRGRPEERVDGLEAVDVATGKRLWLIPGATRHAAFSADGTHVALANAGQARLFEARTGVPVSEWKGHEPFPSEEQRIEFVLLSRALGVANTAGEEDERSPLDDPHLLDEPVTVAHLKDLSRRDLRLLRNTVYARRGRVFQSPLLQQHFGRMGWYRPDPAYTDARLTAQDKRNVKVIRSVEAQVGGPISDQEQELFEGA